MSTYSEGSASSVSRWRYRAGWVSASSRVMQYRDTCTGERMMMRTRELEMKVHTKVFNHVNSV